LARVTPVVSYVVQSLITVAAISALAVLVLYAARRIGVGRPSGPLALVGRLPLEGRRAVYLVRVGETVYVVGSSEAGLVKLGEFARQELGAADDAPATTFSQVLSRIRGGPRAGLAGGTRDDESKS
jgi:flagellar biogenesis protein FliO